MFLRFLAIEAPFELYKKNHSQRSILLKALDTTRAAAADKGGEPS